MKQKKIPIAVAAAAYGRSTDAMRAWICRWNRQHPSHTVRRHPGYVDLNDLERAMEAWDGMQTPSLRVAKSISIATAQGGG